MRHSRIAIPHSHPLFTQQHRLYFPCKSYKTQLKGRLWHLNIYFYSGRFFSQDTSFQWNAPLSILCLCSQENQRIIIIIIISSLKMSRFLLKSVQVLLSSLPIRINWAGYEVAREAMDQFSEPHYYFLFRVIKDGYFSLISICMIWPVVNRLPSPDMDFLFLFRNESDPWTGETCWTWEQVKSVK